MTHRSWGPTAEVPALGPRALHVWWVDLREVGGASHGWLSGAEAERARAAAGGRGRARAAARAELRRLLGAYLRRDPGSLEISDRPGARPCLVRRHAHEPDLYFSVSHSADMALLAFTWAGRVGVDIEEVRDLGASRARLARRMGLATRAPDMVRRPDQRAGAVPDPDLLLQWCRREALFKLTGTWGTADPTVAWQLDLWPVEGAVGALAAAAAPTDVCLLVASRAGEEPANLALVGAGVRVTSRP